MRKLLTLTLLFALLFWATPAFAQDFPGTVVGAASLPSAGDNLQINTTLSLAIGSGTAAPLTMTVVSTTGWPSAGYVIVGATTDREVMRYTSKTATTFDIAERSIDGASPRNHNATDVVFLGVVNVFVSRMIDEIIAIETELGVDPAGASATVVARLDALDTTAASHLPLTGGTMTGALLFADAAGPTILNESATSTNPTFAPNKSDPDTGIGWVSADKLSLIAGGVAEMTLVAGTAQFATATNLIWTTDNDSDIGAAGATRPRTLYVGTSVVTPLTQSGDGTEALPSYTFTSDPNTGAWRRTTDVLAWSTAGAQRWEIGAAGHLIAADNDTYDIGSGSADPRTVYAGTSVVTPLVTFSAALTATNAAGPTILDEAATATNPTLIPDKSDPDTGVGRFGSDALSLVAGGAEILRVQATNTSLLAGDFFINSGNLVIQSGGKAFFDGGAHTYWYQSIDDVLDAVVGGSRRWSITNGAMIAWQSLLFGVDDAIDIGASGATRPRTIYVGTSVITGGVTGGTTTGTTAVCLEAAMSGATVTAANCIPAGSFVFGVTVYVDTEIEGATTFTIGDGVDPDRWGTGILLPAATVTDITDFTADGHGMFSSANDVVLTATGSDFTAGAVTITVHYLTLAAGS